MQFKRSSFLNLKTLFNGVLMGTANKIPGVSGGLVAIAIGFYEELIFSLKRFDKKAIEILFKFKFKEFFKYINGEFLSLILTGIIISYFSTSIILDILLEKYALFVWCLFFGLVIGSVIHLRKIIHLNKPRNLLFILFGISVGVFISLAEIAPENDNLYFIFLCGIVSIVGMILPGLSGSFLLILMGNYTLLLVDSVMALYDSLKEIIKGDFSGFNNPERLNYIKIILVFCLGSLTGLISLSKLLSFLLKKFNQFCNSIIFGFSIGSLGAIWPWRDNYDPGDEFLRKFPELNFEKIIALLFIMIGVSIVLILSSYEKK